VLHAVAVPSVELTRQHWEEGYRRLEQQRHDRGLYRELHAYVEAVTAELRRRVGSRFELTELSDCYRAADRWAPDAIEARAEAGGWPRWVSTAVDAAFHLYARGARDYEP
jgi:hypothetical protein